jgi:hypothetical protein
MENTLLKMIEKQRIEESQFIDFSQLTQFEWDQLYVIEPYMSLENLPLDNRSINSLPASIENNEGIVLFIFMQNGQVVQHLEFGRGACDFADSGRLWAYSRDDARFIINDKNRCIPFQ